ncbi:MAG: hypothetical protein Q8O42_15790, partial [Acidobacteriota bacterium]|nr:hypothetical protein [Acidobacteriota bacterium]
MNIDGLHEHVADDQTVGLTAYPTLLKAESRPATEPGAPAMRLFRGQSLDLVFKDDVFGIGFYYKQGLYPSNFNVYFKGGRQEAFVGKGYLPELAFFGLSSKVAIERVIVQTQADGLDPVSWTVSERRIRCPQWQMQRAGGLADGSQMNSSSKPFVWWSTKA